jgi:hypothetical protein
MYFRDVRFSFEPENVHFLVQRRIFASVVMIVFES